MTALTRNARAYFHDREPGRARAWLRANSSIWRHFDPAPTGSYVCNFCGDVDRYILPGARANSFIEPQTKHRLGEVFYGSERKKLYCDGTEE